MAKAAKTRTTSRAPSSAMRTTSKPHPQARKTSPKPHTAAHREREDNLAELDAVRRGLWRTKIRPSWSDDYWKNTGQIVKLAIGMLRQGEAKFEKDAVGLRRQDPKVLAELNSSLESARLTLLAASDFIEVVQARLECIGSGPTPTSTLAIARRARAGLLAEEIGNQGDVHLSEYIAANDPSVKNKRFAEKLRAGDAAAFAALRGTRAAA